MPDFVTVAVSAIAGGVVGATSIYWWMSKEIDVTRHMLEAVTADLKFAQRSARNKEEQVKAGNKKISELQDETRRKCAEIKNMREKPDVLPKQPLPWYERLHRGRT